MQRGELVDFGALIGDNIAYDDIERISYPTPNLNKPKKYISKPCKEGTNKSLTVFSENSK